MKLITETIEDIEVLTEATANGGKSYKIKRCFHAGGYQEP
jgi:hypothetical protein